MNLIINILFLKDEIGNMDKPGHRVNEKQVAVRITYEVCKIISIKIEFNIILKNNSIWYIKTIFSLYLPYNSAFK